eukprot:TRINITY_DN8086_c0_g1_i1.p1 TRINITY_DN8086_c0_g1~~TRINITY_DN8086_c0_g1_i1.p1  ORF type:complete len:629 (+),score=126.46 TRINITY_DN8086_c0_g1_i1:96-1982(+)
MMSSSSPQRISLLCIITTLLASFAAFAANAISVDSALYPHKVVLMENFYTLHWRVDVPNDDIFFALEVNTTGFVGFGIAEPTSGSMPGADVVIGSVRSSQATVQDMYTTEFATPLMDECQDWHLVDGREDSTGGVTIIEVTRKLHANDTRDRDIPPGLVRIIYSFSASNSDTLGYHRSNRGFTAVRFYENTKSLPVQYTDMDVSTAEYHVNDARIPAQATTYMCRSFALPVSSGPSHIIQIDPLVDPVTKPYVHHFFIHSCKNISGGYVQQYYSNPAVCSTPVGRPSSGCTSELYAWAMGGGSLIVPQEAGYRMSNATDGISHIVIELHYSNPNRLPNLVDNSGVRIHWTPNLRQYDAGVLQLGDPFLTLDDIPAGKPDFQYETTCPSQCTRQWSHDIIVFQDFLHMHELGDMIWTTQWSNGTTSLGPINRIEYYAFAQQQISAVTKVIKRGDRLNTHCAWNTMSKSTPTPMGIETTDEMCIDFLFYYPALRTSSNKAYSYCGNLNHPAVGSVSMCGASATDVVLVPQPSVPDPTGGLVKQFGLSGDACGGTVIIDDSTSTSASPTTATTSVANPDTSSAAAVSATTTASAVGVPREGTTSGSSSIHRHHHAKMIVALFFIIGAMILC